ncbi:MAG: hypothetical protein ACI4VP_05730 [Clostridia bacterium]
MYHFSRRDRQEAIFERMRENGETLTLMYLYGNEIDKLLKEHYTVIPKAVHPHRPQLFLCEVTLPEEE